LAYVETDTTNGPLTFSNSLFYHGGTGAFTNSGNITLAASTATYRAGSGTGTDPLLVAPNATWRGTPANAWNSQVYGTTKGYSSAAYTPTPNATPTLAIAVTPTGGTAPLTVQFTATAADSDGIIASYAWDFGNGSTSFLPNRSFTYALPGTYPVTCTVTDNRGATATGTLTITASVPTNPVELRIEAGSTSAFTDSSGKIWAADYGYDAGGGIVDRGAIVGAVVSFNVTSQVATEAAGDDAISFSTEADNEDYMSYHSKEATNPAYVPVLEVVVTP
jgi:PKD repeat protein